MDLSSSEDKDMSSDDDFEAYRKGTTIAQSVWLSSMEMKQSLR